MKIFVKHIAFAVLWFGHDLSTYASDLPRDELVENTSISTVHPATLPDIRTIFEAEFDVQIQRAVRLFEKVYGKSIDTTPEYLLDVLNEACTFLGDSAPFRLDDVASLRKCQSYLKPLNSRGRYSITKPGDFNEHSFVPRLIIPMAEFIHGSSDFSKEEKILATTYFDKSDPRIFDFDNSMYASVLRKPIVLKFFLLKTLSKCIVDFHLIIKLLVIEQLRGVEIPLSVIHRHQILDSLTSFGMDAARSPNVMIDGKIASIVHKNIASFGSDLFLTTVRCDLLEYFASDTFFTISQMCLRERI